MLIADKNKAPSNLSKTVKFMTSKNLDIKMPIITTIDAKIIKEIT